MPTRGPSPHLTRRRSLTGCLPPPRQLDSNAWADAPIDLWDATSFDPGLTAILAANTDLMRAHVREQAVIDQAYEADPRQMIRASNSHWDDHHELECVLDKALRTRVARAWHYTRLTDPEVAAIANRGVELSTSEGLRRRLDAVARSGALTEAQAEAILVANPLNNDPHGVRTGQFCAAAYPLPVTSLGVERLLRVWGGEVASLHLEDPVLLAVLERIGRPHVLEVAVPLATIRPSTALGKSAIAAFAHAEGIDGEAFMPDLFALHPLGSEAILAVHSEGAEAFAALGCTYPERTERTLLSRLIGD